MKVAVLRERAPNECRVACTPDIVKMFVKDGFTVYCEKDCGHESGFFDEDYLNAGATVTSVLLEILGDADIVLKVQPAPLNFSIHEFLKEGSITIGLLSPNNNHELIRYYCDKGITAVSMELLPRITKAQNMDVLSSQANIAGYRAVIEAASHSRKIFPMLMTAAGTITSAKVLVLGAGVAGLQAIATAKRLGGAVFAYDVRSAAKEQVESLGAKFVTWSENIDQETKSGYAQSLYSNQQERQNAFLMEQVSKYDVIIATAQIPHKPAPVLITKDMIARMKPGSVVVDMAGGNVELYEKDKVIEVDRVKIVGYSNLASRAGEHSSKLYSKNLYNFVKYAFVDNALNFEDEVIKKMILTYKGVVLYGE